MTRPLILVTGATGTIGREVARQLVDRGARVRALTRDPKKAKQFSPSVEVVTGDLERPDTLAPVFAGVDRVFVMANYPLIAVLEGNAYAAAKEAGVRHIVKLSGRHVNADFFLGAALADWHRTSEHRLQSLGIPWTIVRPGSFASNFLAWFDRQQRTVFLPVGDGQDSFIDPRDVAACIVHALTTPGHDGRIYEITGSEPLTLAQATAKISAAAGATVRYQNIPESAARQGLLSMGMPSSTAESFLTYFAAIRNGQIYPPTSAVADLLGRPAHSLDEWARDNAAAFRAG